VPRESIAIGVLCQAPQGGQIQYEFILIVCHWHQPVTPAFT
jgi:hypothetical protein